MKPILQPSRRSVLRGLGAAVALPWLESAGLAAPLASGDAPAIPRLAWVYVPNGVHMPEWCPSEEDPSAPLPPILGALEPYRAELAVLRGLTQDKARANGDGGGDHARAAAAWLTGVQPLKTDGQVRLGVSADQLAADSIGRATRFRSLVLGAEGARTSGQCDSGYACAYSGNISWQGPETPAGKETDPVAIFDRLFRGGVDARSLAAEEERRSRRRSVLDAVRQDARSLLGRVSRDDRLRLDEYLDGVRELERRIELARPERVDEVPDSSRPEAPETQDERIRLLLDLVVLAFRTDQTRVATMMIANEGSNSSYPQLGISEGHHTLSHHREDPEMVASIARINVHHVSHLAHLLEGLSAARDGAGSLLEQTAVVYGSGIADGNRHTHHDLPTVLAGGRGSGLVTVPPGAPSWPVETPLNNLHVALLQRAGVPVETLGDSTGVLEI